MNIIREVQINRRLKKALDHHQCRLSGGIKSLRDGAQLTLEPGVKIGKAKIYAPTLEVGAYTDVVSGCEFLDVARIGRYCSIATGVVIGQGRHSHPMDWLTTHNFPSNPQLLRRPTKRHAPRIPTVIGNDVWIGRDVLILDGVTVGTGSVIGAQSLVNKDVPPYAIVAGSPARVIRYRFSPEAIERLLASRWWELPLDALGELLLDDPEACLDALERQGPPPQLNPQKLQVRSKPWGVELLPT
ncbi:CatB-related O-acetyltransferase [Pseudomonas sp. QL9]|uniref:CatB-related O-acetyltransferase n=1 Tax=Pseudomonas sp. QL9 TaxID=3242725 RepID=UPI00352A0348